MNKELTKDIVLEFLQPLATSLELFVVDVSLKGTMKHRILGVYIDKPNGISIEDCSTLQRLIDEHFENFELSSSISSIEVSSPGFDKPLMYDWQLSNHITRVCLINADSQEVKGRIFSTGENGEFTVEIQLPYRKGVKQTSELEKKSFQFSEIQSITIIPEIR